MSSGAKLRTVVVRLTMLAVVPVTLSGQLLAQATRANAVQPATASHNAAKVPAKFGDLPLSFEPYAKAGQQTRYVSHGRGYALSLSATEADLDLQTVSRDAGARTSSDALIRLRLLGARATAVGEGEQVLAGKANYLFGNDRSQWRRNVSTYGRVRFRDVYPGIDVIYYGNQRLLEHDFEVAPGADPGHIRFSMEGATKLHVDAAGNLVAHTPGGELRLHKPILYQKSGDQRHSIRGNYVVASNGEISIAVGDYDRKQQLVIDPVLSYSTYLGGTGSDTVSSMAVDGAGNTYLVGSFAAGFPATQASFAPGPCSWCPYFYVTKVNPSGTGTVYSTYIGATGTAYAYGVATDASGDAYVTGGTGATDFPITAGAAQTTAPGSLNAYVLQLDATGSTLLYSSYLGGATYQYASSIAVDPGSNPSFYISGLTYSPDFPAVGPVNSTAPSAIYSSTDSGASWSAGSGLNSLDIQTLAIDGNTPATLYAGTFGGGVFKSTDAGATWSATALQRYYVTSNLLWDPTTTGSSATVYAGGYSVIARLDGGGATSTSIGLNGNVSTLALDPNNSANLYAATTNAGVYLITGANGSTPVVTQLTTTGLPTYTNSTTLQPLNAMLVDSTTGTIYVGTQQSGVYALSSGGTSWTAVNTGFTSTYNYIYTLAEDANGILYAGTSSGPFKTSRSNISWTSIGGTGSIVLHYTRKILIDPASTTTLYALAYATGSATASTTIYRSTDGGSTWTLATTGLPSVNVDTFTIDPTNSAHLYVGAANVMGFAAKFTSGGALTYSVLYGGVGSTYPDAAATDGSGNLYIGGSATGTTLPSPVVGPSTPTGSFVAKLNPDGSVAYSRYFGGSGGADVNALAADSSGNLYVAGDAYDSTFPVTAGSAFQTTFNGTYTSPATLTEIDPTGSNLLYSTLYGGSNYSYTTGITLLPNGRVGITGETYDTDLPTVNAPQAYNAGSYDAFYAEFDTSKSGAASLPFATYLGGNSYDYPAGVGVDSSGNRYIAGYTNSTNFPVTSGVLQGSNAGTYDAFVTKIGSNGNSSDVSVAISASTGSVHLGDTFTYTITVTNAGPNASGATSVKIYDALPTGIAIAGAVTSTQGTCSATTAVGCSLGTVPVSGTVTITVPVVVSSGTGPVNNKVVVSTADDDPAPANNSAAVTITVLPSADVAVSFGGGSAPTSIALNVPQQVDLKAYNFGPNTATGVSATVSLSPANGGIFSNYPSNCSVVSSNLVCSLGSLASSTTNNTKLTYSLTPTVVGSISLNYAITANEYDPNPGNNSAAASTTVVSGAGTFLSGNFTPASPVSAGAAVTYTFNVGNSGPGVPPQFTVNFAAPPGFTVTSISSPLATCTTAPLSCVFGAPGAPWSTTITLSGTANQVGTYTMAAAIDDGGYASTGNLTLALPLTVLPAAGASEYYVVSDTLADKLHLFNIATNIESLPAVLTGNGPTAVAISPNGRIAYVVGRLPHYISVVDLTQRREIERWAYAASPFAATGSVALTADGTKLLVVAHSAVLIFNTANGQLLAAPSLPGPYAVAVAGNVAFVNSTNSTYGVYTVDLNTFAVTGIAGSHVGSAPYRITENKTIAATADGRYVVAARNTNLIIIDTASGNAITTVSPTSGAAIVRVTRDPNSPGGVYAYFANGKTVGAVDLNSGSNSFGQVVQTVSVPYTAEALDLSQDGQSLLVLGDANAAGEIVRISTSQLISNPSTAITFQQQVTPATDVISARGITDGFVVSTAPATAPTISSVSPSSFATDAAQTITIAGTNFSTDALVRIGHMPLLTPSSVTSTQIQVSVPALSPAGTANVVVIDRNGGSSLQQQNQSAVMVNGVTIGQVSTFQPAYNLVTGNLDESVSYGTRTLNYTGLGLDYYVPTDVVVSSDGTRAYVSSATGGVPVVNLSNGSTETTIPFANGNVVAGEAVRGLYPAVTGGAAVYVATQVPNGSSGSTQLYDMQVQAIDASGTSPTLNQIVGTFNAGLAVDGYENAVTVTSDGHYAYVEYQDNSNASPSIVAMDLTTGTTGTPVIVNALGPNNSGAGPVEFIGITPDNKYLVLPNANYSSMDFYDIGSNPMVPTWVLNVPLVSPSTELDAFQVLGNQIVTADFLNGVLEVFSYAPGTLAPAPTVSPLGQATVPDVGSYYVNGLHAPVVASADGNYIYVAIQDRDMVDVFSTSAIAASNAGGALVARMATGGQAPFAITVSPTALYADLEAQLLGADTGQAVISGQNGNYNLVATNHGPANATGVVLTNTLPAGMTLVSAPGCSGTTTITCNVGSLPSGTSASFPVTVSITGGVGSVLTLSASVTGNEPDNNSANNTASIGINVVGGADLAITGSVSPVNPQILGSPTTLSFVATNVSGDTVPAVHTNLAVPAGFVVTGVSSTVGTCSTVAPLFCDLGQFGAGQSATITITGTPNLAGTGSAIATIAGYADANPANNTASVTVTTSPLANTSEYYFVGQTYSDSLRQFRIADNTEVTPASMTGASPVSTVISPNGRTAYVLSRGYSYVSVVDIPTRTEIARWSIPNASYKTDLVLTADGSKLIASGNAQVTILDASSGAILATPYVPNAQSSVVLGNTLYVNVNNGGLAYATVDLTTYGVTTIPWGANIGGGGGPGENRNIAATPDGRYLVALRFNKVELVDLNNNVVYLIPVPGGINARSVIITRDASDANGVFAFIETVSPRLLVFDLRESSATFGQFLSQAVTLPFNVVGGLTFSADGSKIIAVGSTVSGGLSTTATGVIATLNVGTILSNPSAAITTQTTYGTRDTGGAFFRGVTDAYAFAGPVSGMPTVTAVQPSVITADSSHTLTITGTNFTSGAMVRLGHSDWIQASVLSPTQIQVTVPALVPAGPNALTVAVIQSTGAGAQQQFQAGVLANALTIQQTASFQPANPVVTLGFLDTLDFGGRVLNGHLNFSRNFQVLPAGYTLSSDGKRAYVITVDGITVSNLTTGTVEATIAPPASNSGWIQLRPGTNPSTGQPAIFALAYTQVLNAGSDQYYDYAVEVIDAQDGSSTVNQIVRTVDAGVSLASEWGTNGGFAVAPDGHYVYMPLFDNTGTLHMWVFDMVAHTATQGAALPEMDQNVLWPYMNITPDGHYLLALANSDGGTLVYDVVTNRAVPALAGHISPVEPSGSFRAMQVIGSRLYTSDGSHFEAFNFLPGATPDFSYLGSYTDNSTTAETFDNLPMALSPDGQFLYAVSSNNDTVRVFSTAAIASSNAGSALVASMQTSDGPYAIAMSSTGTPTTDVAVSIQPGSTGADVVSGGTYSYQLVATNGGPVQATGVTITDALPAGTTVVSAPGCNASATAIACVAGTLLKGSSASFTVTLSATGSAGTVLTTTAAVTANENDGNQSNNSASFSVTIVSGADLFINGTATNSTPALGSQVTFNVNVGNSSGDTVSSMVAQFAMPSGFAFQSATPSGGTCSSGLPLQCTFANVRPGISFTIAITGTVNQPVATQLTGTVSGYADTNTSNNTVSIAINTALASGMSEYYFIAEAYGHKLHQYLMSNNTEVTPPSTAGLFPQSVVISPNGRAAYVASRFSHYISAVDLTTRTEAARWTYTGGNSFDTSLALNADGTKLVVTNDGTLAILDAATGNVLAQPLFTGVRGVAVAGNTAYVNTLTTGVESVDLSSFAINPIAGTNAGNANYAFDTKSIAITPDGRYVVAVRKAYIVLIDRNNANQVATVPVTGGIARELAVSRDTSAANGVFAYFTVYDQVAQTSSLRLLDLRPGSSTFGQILAQSVSLPFDTGFAPRSIALSADSTSLFLTGTTGTAGAYVRIDTGLLLSNPGAAIVLQQAFTPPQLSGTRSTARGVTTAFALVAPLSTAPTVASVQPSTIVTDTPQTITINGANFSSDAIVRIGSMDPLMPTSISPTQIQVVVPALAPSQTAANVVVIDRNANLAFPLQDQTGVLPGALTILQANSFQPAHPLVTTDSDEFVGFGARSLAAISLLGHNFFEPSGMAIAPDGVRAYTGTTEGIATVNLTNGQVETFAKSGTVVNVDATQNGCSQCNSPQNVLPGTVVNILGPKVQVTLPVGTYRITNAAGMQGALYSGWNFNNSGANWVWSFMVANDANSTILMDDYINSTQSSLTAIAGLINTPTYNGNTLLAATSTAGFTDELTLTQTTTLDFFIDDYGLSDNIGGVSLLIQSVDQQIAGKLVSTVDFATGNPVIMGVAQPQAGSDASGPLYTVQVQMIDPRDGSPTVNQVVKLVTAGLSVHQSYLGGFAVTSDGHYGYIQMADNNTGAISLIIFNFQDGSATEVAEPSINPNWYALRVTPDNHYLVAGAASMGGLVVFDISSTPLNPALVQTVAPQGSATLYDGFQMHGSTAYALSFNVPQVIQTFTYAPGATPFTYQNSFAVPDEAQYPNVNDPAPLAVSPDGSLIYLPVVDADMVDVLSASVVASGSGNALVARLGSSMAPFLAEVSPNATPAADMALSLTIADVLDDSDLQYSFTVTNNGAATASNVQVLINVPSGTTPSAPSGCAQNGGQMTCTIASLASGASQVLTLDHGIVRGPGTVFPVSGSVVADQNDGNLANNSASGQSTILTAVDLNFYNVTTSTTSARVGDSVTYTFNIYNAGPDDAAAVNFTDVLPAGATLVSGTVANSYTTGGTCSGTSTVTCSVGPLPYDWTATVTLVLQLSQAGTVVDTGSVSASEFDPVTTNNSISATVQVAPVADLAISLNPTSDLASTVTVTNNGPSTANGVVLSGNVQRFQVTSLTASQGSACTVPAGDGSISCPLGTLASGASATVTIAMNAPSTGWAGVWFYAAAQEYDPNLNNNTARVPTSPGSGLNTQAGLNVSVTASGTGIAANVNFDNVTQAGTTSVTEAPFTAAAPAGFRSGNPALVYDVSTTAIFAGAVHVTLPFNPGTFHHPGRVRIFHLEGGAWVDRTLAVDSATGLITAGTTSLSPFLIAEPVNTVPLAKAATANASATSAAGAAVKLDATQSTDADGDALTYRWTGAFPEGGGMVTGATPTVTLTPGAHQLSLVVNDGEADSQPLAVTATVADFQLGVANGAQTVSSGQSATFAVHVGTQFGAFTNLVALSCSNLPAGYACAFAPAQVVPGTQGSSTTLTIGPAQSARNRRVPLWPVTFAFGLVLTGGLSKRRRWLMLLMIAALLAAVACGGGTSMNTQSTTTPAKQATTTVVTISGTSGGVVHSATVSLTIQQP